MSFTAAAPTMRDICATLIGRPAKRAAKFFEMLAREQRGRHDDRDLLAVDRGDEGGAQRDFGLAEADIAADEPVHRPAARQDRRARPRWSRPGLRSLHKGSRRRRLRRGRAAARASAPHGCAARRRSCISCAAISRMRLRIFALRFCQPAPPSLSSWTSVSSEP